MNLNRRSRLLAAVIPVLVGLTACGYDPTPQDLQEDAHRRSLLRNDPAFAQVPAPGVALVGCNEHLPEFFEGTLPLDFGHMSDNEMVCTWRLTAETTGAKPVRGLLVAAIAAAEAEGWTPAGVWGWGWEEVDLTFTKNIEGVWARLNIHGDLRREEGLDFDGAAFPDGPVEIRYSMPAVGSTGFPPDAVAAEQGRRCADALDSDGTLAPKPLRDGSLAVVGIFAC